MRAGSLSAPPAGLTLALLVAVGLVLSPACGGPTFPTSAETDCTGVTPSSDTCDTSTARLPIPDLPNLACPTPAEIQEIREDIPVAVGGDVSAGVLACRESDGSVDLTVVQNLIYQSLLFLRRVRFDRPLPWTSLPVYDWLRATIPNGIVIESSGASRSCLGCRGPIHIVFTFYDSLRPTVYYLAHTLLVHEARHAEGKGHTCGYSPQYGTFTRDKSVAEMGGFGVHYLLAYWIGHYSNEAAALRDYSSKHAAQLIGQGSFCCECGRGKTAQVSLMARLFARPSAGPSACGGQGDLPANTLFPSSSN